MTSLFDRTRYYPSENRGRIQGFPLAATESTAVTGLFGPDPWWVNNGKVGHTGVDLSVSKGTPLYAPADGKLHADFSETGGYGKFVVIEHGNGLYSAYAHLDDYDKCWNKPIQQGDKIGVSGNTGKSTAPHLHWALSKKLAFPRWSSSPDFPMIDPLLYVPGFTDPLNIHDTPVVETPVPFEPVEKPWMPSESVLAQAVNPQSIEDRVTVLERRLAALERRNRNG